MLNIESQYSNGKYPIPQAMLQVCQPEKLIVSQIQANTNYENIGIFKKKSQLAKEFITVVTKCYWLCADISP